MMGTVHHFIGRDEAFDWEGVPETGCEGADVRGVIKKVLVGPGEEAPNFYMRYFRVEPGGYTNLDEHPHDHGVLILHGRATVLLGDRQVTVTPRDIVYVAPNEVHQFRALGNQALGFLCVIPAL